MTNETTLTIAQQINLIEHLLEQDEKYREYSKQLPNDLYCSLTELPMFEANEMKIDILTRAALCPELLEEYAWMAYEFPFLKKSRGVIFAKDCAYEIKNNEDFISYLEAVYLREE